MDRKEDLAAGVRNKAHSAQKGGIEMTELDRMYEIACAQDWEEQNTTNIPGWADAIKNLEKCADSLKDACYVLDEAAGLIEESVEVDRVRSLMDEIEFLRKDVIKQTERMKTA